MELLEIVQRILSAPTPEALWHLHGYLLAADSPTDAPLMQTVEAFHHYLLELQSKASARQYSELASLLDIGAVGGVALQNMVGSSPRGGAEEARRWLERLLMGSAGESLMVLASRQYVKGWQSELGSVHERAVWFLASALWRFSVSMRPDLPASERWAHIQSMLAPARAAETPHEDKAVLLGRLFQVLTLGGLLPYFST